MISYLIFVSVDGRACRTRRPLMACILPGRPTPVDRLNASASIIGCQSTEAFKRGVTIGLRGNKPLIKEEQGFAPRLNPAPLHPRSPEVSRSGFLRARPLPHYATLSHKIPRVFGVSCPCSLVLRNMNLSGRQVLEGLVEGIRGGVSGFVDGATPSLAAKRLSASATRRDGHISAANLPAKTGAELKDDPTGTNQLPAGGIVLRFDGGGLDVQH
jgi:hypothetical protein